MDVNADLSAGLEDEGVEILNTGSEMPSEDDISSQQSSQSSGDTDDQDNVQVIDVNSAETSNDTGLNPDEGNPETEQALNDLDAELSI